jgi:hypothetical protein
MEKRKALFFGMEESEKPNPYIYAGFYVMMKMME